MRALPTSTYTKLLKSTEVSLIFVDNVVALAEKPSGGGVRGIPWSRWEEYLWVEMVLAPPTPLLLLSSSALSRNIWGSVPSDPVKTHPGTLGLTPGQSHARIWKVWVAVGISLP